VLVVVQYDLLGGRGQGDKRTAEMLLPYMINRGSSLTTDVIHLAHKWQRKDGKMLTLRTRNQVYYTKSGWVPTLPPLHPPPLHFYDSFDCDRPSGC
jgi:hypothetical protein